LFFSGRGMRKKLSKGKKERRKPARLQTVCGKKGSENISKVPAAPN